MRPLRMLLAMSALTLGGCQSSPVSVTELRHLAAAEAKWASKGFTDYSVDVRISCGECPPRSGQLTRVDVQAGAFLRAVIVATGEDISAEYGGPRTPVESQFAWIRQANRESLLRDLVITFDAELGFPSYVASMYDPSLADGGGATYLSDVRPLVVR